MQIQQLSIFIANKSGRLAEITEVLASENIGIRAISVADTSDYGILRLIVDKPTKAVEVIKKAGLTVSLTNVIAVGIDDKTGEFSKSMRILADNLIDVEYMYAFIGRESGKAFVILRVEDNNKAIDVLKKNGVSILPAKAIYGM